MQSTSHSSAPQRRRCPLARMAVWEPMALRNHTPTYPYQPPRRLHGSSFPPSPISRPNVDNEGTQRDNRQCKHLTKIHGPKRCSKQAPWWLYGDHKRRTYHCNFDILWPCLPNCSATRLEEDVAKSSMLASRSSIKLTPRQLYSAAYPVPRSSTATYSLESLQCCSMCLVEDALVPSANTLLKMLGELYICHRLGWLFRNNAQRSYPLLHSRSLYITPRSSKWSSFLPCLIERLVTAELNWSYGTDTMPQAKSSPVLPEHLLSNSRALQLTDYRQRICRQCSLELCAPLTNWEGAAP